MTIREQLAAYRVLPVITAEDVESTVALSRALLEGGMRAVEITLRTDAALEAIAAVRSALPEMAVAAGTVTNPRALQAAVEAGCDFYVSPGLTEQLLAAAREAEVSLVPGVATPSEIMLGMDYGLDCFKLFPAVPVGGIALLKALAGPFPGLAFCPTGGLSPDNFREFLALPNVVCCGGSWMVAAELVQREDWDTIRQLAAAAMNDNQG
jgi:2-dehydro-3-deoxyphosphogluconate aldolase/(4S)-4-hydroxy-2-oxoglutarate aldolase